MDTLLHNGDFLLDSRGLPQTVDGKAELAQRAMIRLICRKGGFAPNPKLDSELYRLKRGPAAQMNRAAQGYVMDALAPMAGAKAGEITCRYDPEEDRIELSLELALGEASTLLEVNL